VKHTQLVPQGEVLRLQDCLGFEERCHESEKEKGEFPHDHSNRMNKMMKKKSK
jgi:hypothetical protein